MLPEIEQRMLVSADRIVHSVTTGAKYHAPFLLRGPAAAQLHAAACKLRACGAGKALAHPILPYQLHRGVPGWATLLLS